MLESNLFRQHRERIFVIEHLDMACLQDLRDILQQRHLILCFSESAEYDEVDVDVVVDDIEFGKHFLCILDASVSPKLQ